MINNRDQLTRELGRGGMGAVYAANDTVLGAPVAIKVLLFDRPGPKLVGRFMQEARAAAQVRHTNIVSVLDIGQDVATGALFLVQEFLLGQDLKRRILGGGPLSPREAIETLYPIMRALDFAHSKGIVHRDLKPDNIFLCETHDGIVPKVIDFGIAKVTDGHGQSAQNTATAQVIGTPYYMAPEQARGDRAVDHRADVWSLGVVLFYALTRRYPHEGTTTNLIISNIITRQPTPITAYAPTLPPQVVITERMEAPPRTRRRSVALFAAVLALGSGLGLAIYFSMRHGGSTQPASPPTAIAAVTAQTPRPAARPAAQPSAPPSAASTVAPAPVAMAPAVVAAPRVIANAAPPPTRARAPITQPAQPLATRIGARARPRPGTRILTAQALSLMGRFAASHAAATQCLRDVEVETQTTEANRAGLRARCTELRDEVAPRIARLTVRVPAGAPPEMEVRIDGDALSPAQLDVERVVDPGAVTVRAVIPGRAPWEHVQPLSAGERQRRRGDSAAHARRRANSSRRADAADGTCTA
ncbi:MAG: protein kinase [Polyangiales bacterium]